MNEWPTWRTFRGKVLRKCRMFFSGGYFKLKSLICLFLLKIYKKKTTNKQTNPACLFFFLFLFFCRYKETTDVLNEITSAKKYSKFLRPFHKGNRQKKCIVTLNARNPKLRDQPRKGPNMVLWALKRVFMVLSKLIYIPMRGFLR